MFVILYVYYALFAVAPEDRVLLLGLGFRVTPSGALISIIIIIIIITVNINSNSNSNNNKYIYV